MARISLHRFLHISALPLPVSLAALGKKLGKASRWVSHFVLGSHSSVVSSVPTHCDFTLFAGL